MSYRESIIQDLNGIANDIECVHDELVDILDLNDMEEIKIAISNAIQTVNDVLLEVK